MILPSLLAKDIYRHNNGLKHINITNSEGFSALFVVNTPITDNSGVAHGVEHLVFRGSTAFPKPETLFQLTSLTDAKINASTFNNTTYFHCQSMCPHTFILAINYLLNGLFDPVFNSKDLSYEIHDGKDKGVIYRELLGSEQAEREASKSPDKSHIKCKDNEEFCYGGISSSIGQLSQQDLSSFHQKFYHAENITLVTANADIKQISQLMSLLPKQRPQEKKIQVTVDRLVKDTSKSEVHKQTQQKYSPGINTLIALYHAWLASSFYQEQTYCQINNSIINTNETIESDAANFLSPDSQLILPLVNLSHQLTKNKAAQQQMTSVELENTIIKRAPNKILLPSLFTQLLHQAKKQLHTNEQASHELAFVQRQAQVYSQSNALWLAPINTTDQVIATISSYIISAYPEFLMPRYQGYCYATQAVAIEHSTYLAIYSAFDASPKTRITEFSQRLLHLSNNNDFINSSLALAKIKYSQAFHLNNNQVIQITPFDISAYLQALANSPHPKV